MIIIREGDLTLSLRTLEISFNIPDTESKTTRHPFDKMASIQIGTKIQIRMDSINKIVHATPGTMDQIIVSRLSITSMLDQRIPILSITETSLRATICLHPTQFSSSAIRDKL